MKNLIKILILNIFILCTTQECMALTSVQLILTTTVPAAVNITAINPAAANGTINAETGVSSSPSASFQLQTNGDDVKYTYVVQAKLLTTGSVQTNAYAQISSNGYILLGNNGSSVYPTLAAVNNITGGSPNPANNANVIAYPVTNTLSNLSSATLTNNAVYGGLCYIVKTGSNTNGTIVQTVGSAPLANTYSISNDRAGTYQAIVTFTANRNP